MNKPDKCLRFAQTRGKRYSIALFETGYIIEYTHERKTGLFFRNNLEELQKAFERILTLSKEIDNITYIELN